MNEKDPQDQLEQEISRKHYARAELLAASRGLPEQELRDLKQKALWQISAVSRNLPGTRILANLYGYTKNEVAELLRKEAAEEKEKGGYKAIEPCYDPGTARYLTFEDWLEQLLKNWDKLPAD
jgi:hypothetical protein